MRYFFSSIKTKIIVTVLLLVTFLTAVLSLAAYRFFCRTFIQALSNQHQMTLKMAAYHLEKELTDSEEALAKIATALPSDRLSDPGKMQAVLETYALAATNFDGGMAIVDSHLAIVAEIPHRQQRHGLNPAFGHYLQGILHTKKPCISAPYLSSPTNHPTVAVGVPVLGRDGSVTAIVIGRFDLLTSTRFADISRLGFGNSGYIFVTDRDRVVLMHPERHRIMQQIERGRLVGIESAIATGRPQASEGSNWRGVRGLYAALPLQSAGWVVASFYPLPEAHEMLKVARVYFLIAFTLILVSASCSLWLLIRRITAPLEKLTRHVRALRSEEGEARQISLSTGDELESLGEAFNVLVSEMDQKQAVLEDNFKLYRAIAEFTSEMAYLRNADGTLQFVTANCLALTGYCDLDFYADPRLFETITHPEDVALMRREVTAAEEGEAVRLRLVKKDGEIRWFSDARHLVKNDNGELLGIRGSLRDITQKKILETQLEEQRQFAEKLLESTSTPLFVIDADHRVIFWNRAVAELTGYRPEQMLGTSRHWQPFYPEERPTLSDLVLDGRSDVIERYYKKFGRPDPHLGVVRAEQWYADINGESRYLVFDAAPVYRHGKIVAVVETLSDITDRATAERSLRLFSQAVEQSGNAVMITDSSGCIQYVNTKLTEMTGYSSNDLVGSEMSLLLGRQSAEAYEELLRVIGESCQWHGELQSRRKDGTLFWQSTTVSPIVDRSRTSTYFLVIGEDISARKQAERDLKAKQAELVLKHEQLGALYVQVEQGKREWEQTMDCIDDIVVMTDADHRVKRCNRALMELTGATYLSVKSQDWRELFRRAGLDLDSVTGGSGEIFHSGSERWFALKTYRYGEAGGEVVTLHDLTAIKLVSEQLAHAYDELKATHSQMLQQEKMASIGQLAAGVAHEINNPIGFISSNLGTMEKYLERLESFLALLEGALPQLPEEAREGLERERGRLKIPYILNDAKSLLEESKDGAERVRGIVQNLKSFSRIDDADMKLVDLNECLESTINIAWNELKYKTTLIREYGEIPRVSCLPQQLNQVFLNMLVNAAHAIEKQGEVKVRTWQEDDTVRICISDTGCGIPEEIRNRIFEPFFTTKEVGKGTGLGLSISYDIIKKHGGRFEVDSTVGVGTAFTIVLPIQGV